MYIFENYGNADGMLIRKQNRNLEYHAHLHQCYEFVFCREGKIDVRINGDVFRIAEGYAILITPNTVHSYHSPSASLVWVILFGGALVEAFYHSTERTIPHKYVFRPEGLLTALLDDFFTRDRDTDIYGTKALLYKICEGFCADNSFSPSENGNPSDAARILRFIGERYTSEISLSELSRELGYSYYYTGKLFTKYIGTSFSRFLAEYRVEKVKQLLSHGQIVITDAALSSGFGSIRSFNRCFLDVEGVTPREYMRLSQGMSQPSKTDIAKKKSQ